MMDPAGAQVSNVCHSGLKTWFSTYRRSTFVRRRSCTLKPKFPCLWQNILDLDLLGLGVRDHLGMTRTL